jgi:hypothetical protein
MAGRGSDVLLYSLPWLFKPEQNFAGTLASPMSIAVGDLDKTPDSAGNNHDEIVTAYVNTTLAVQLNVANYSASSNPNPTPSLATLTLTHAVSMYGTILPSDNLLGVTIGDFNGDGMSEIAIVHLQDDQTGWLTIVTYSTDDRGDHRLQEASAIPLHLLQPAPAGFIATVSIAAGDLDGDGQRDELIVGLGEYKKTQPGTPNTTGVIYTRIYQGDPDLNMTEIQNGRLGLSTPFPFNLLSPSEHPRQQVITGLFKFDPSHGYGFGRRQFALGWNNPNGTFSVRAYDTPVNAQGNITGVVGLTNIHTFGSPDFPTNQNFAIGAGNFRGNTKPDSPLWQIGYNFQYHYFPGNSDNYALAILEIEGGNLVDRRGCLCGEILRGQQVRMPVVAYDYDGDSLYLGSPVHIVVTNVRNTSFVLQEPPKHAYYDNREMLDGHLNPDYTKIVNVSRLDGFNVQMKDSNQKTFTSKTNDTTDWAIGGSAAVSAKVTVKTGFDFGLAKAGVQSVTEVSGKGSYDYTQHKDDYNNDFHSRTVTHTGATERDDFITGKAQTLDIWRYRIYGTTPQPDAKNGFSDMVLPGNFTDFDLGGLGLDGYQPLHENGNILSYPSVFGASNNLPDDLGSFTIPCPKPGDPSCNKDNTKTVTAPLIEPQRAQFGGTSGATMLEYTDSAVRGNTLTFNKTLAESDDVKQSFTGYAKAAVGPDISTGVSVAVNFHNSNSWGGSHTGEATTNQTTGITLNRQSGDSSKAYLFDVIFYKTKDGTIKAAHTTDVTGDATGQHFWSGFYGAKPDAALNLPARFFFANGAWQPNTIISRKKLRGFFLTRPEINPVTNAYDYLPGAATAGDKVRVAAHVYNYSTGKPLYHLLVRFQAVEIAPVTDRDIGTRETIGETEVSQLDPLQNTLAAVVWDTTGFGGANPGKSNAYRIYVVLDPNNAIDETYETEDPTKCYPWMSVPSVVSSNVCSDPKNIVGLDPGQNNEGWGLATVIMPNREGEPPTLLSADSFLDDESVAMLSEGKLVTRKAEAVLERPVQLQFAVHSDQDHGAFGDLFIYDGDPAKGGTLLAIKAVHLGNTNGSYVWFDWIPRVPGKHKIFAQLQSHANDPNLENHTDTLDVQVSGRGLIEPICCATISTFKGKAEKVGSGLAHGKVSLSGTVTRVGTVDLRAATVTLQDLLNEADGAGELVQGPGGGELLPLTLLARPGSKANEAIFETSSGAQPKVRVELKQRDPEKGELEFSIKAERVLVRSPVRCQGAGEPRTLLTTSLTLNEGIQGPTEVSIESSWQCRSNELRTP